MRRGWEEGGERKGEKDSEVENSLILCLIYI